MNLSIVRTMCSALGRRIALGGPLRQTLAQLAAQREAGDISPDEARRLDTEIESLRRRIGQVPFLDEIDLLIPAPDQRCRRPMSQAVMFCLMDVSASMDEHKKRSCQAVFHAAVHVPVAQVRAVEIVFIRHTDDADEVTEEQFFHDRKTGGTVVQSALKLMREVIDDRFSPSEWNVTERRPLTAMPLAPTLRKAADFADELLPMVRHFAYPRSHRAALAALVDPGRPTTA
ncbi:MAG: DUF444 family protein [Burkholderiaceae bacterium]